MADKLVDRGLPAEAAGVRETALARELPKPAESVGPPIPVRHLMRIDGPALEFELTQCRVFLPFKGQGPGKAQIGNDTQSVYRSAEDLLTTAQALHKQARLAAIYAVGR